MADVSIVSIRLDDIRISNTICIEFYDISISGTVSVDSMMSGFQALNMVLGDRI